MANYLIYPVKNMRITQSYSGTYSHRPHYYNVRDYKDYPIDEACSDGGRDWFYCPCDGMKVVKKYGVRGPAPNNLWLESTTPVDFANGVRDYCTIMIAHVNDSDMDKLPIGKIFKRGQKMFLEGTDGANGYHFHISVGRGKMTNGGWDKNSNGKWVLRTTKGTYYPQTAFYVNPKFTHIEDSKGINFKTVPANKPKPKYTLGNYRVAVGSSSLLNVRSGPGTLYPKKNFSKLTSNAQQQIKAKNNGRPANGLVDGCICTVTQISKDWGKIPSGWISLKYCKKI